MLRVIVIGGGPAGFMAAIAAAGTSTHTSVDVYDAGLPLATLLRTGGGKCNITNAGGGPRELSAEYPRGGRFLLSAFSRFGPAELMAWFKAREIGRASCRERV
jgi:predicted flavoprotein YhiN